MNDTTSIQDLVARLSRNLEQQGTAVDAITKALREHRTSFVGGLAHDLEAANVGLEQVARRAHELDREQRQVLEELGERIGVHARAIRVTEIASRLHGPEANTLRRRAEVARVAAERLEVETRVGASLLEWSALCHERLLGRLADALAPTSVYARNGHIQPNQAGRLVDATL